MTRLADIGIEDLQDVQGTPLLLNVAGEGVRATEWAAENRGHVERLLMENGALLIRGLTFVGSQQFGTALSTLFGEDLIQYVYRSTPRTELRGNVYTATEYHPDQVIPQHNENSYSNRWAMRLGFLCTIPSQTGGATPICDSRKVYAQMPDALRDRFERNGVMYVRNYSEIDVPWTEVFQTSDRADVEAFCQANQLAFEWLEDGLRTCQINQASAVHPDSGDKVWFNQAHLFHFTNLDPEIREALLTTMGERRLPRNTYYGDGSPIDIGALDTVRALYERNAIRFDWQRNDLLLLDNMLYSHGRETYSGNRQVLVGMARVHGTEGGRSEGAVL
ncbi:Taurine catabolism dioxygenase TauD, TfdA family [Xanthomonas sp. SS]|uniref:TauD/TfdA family dioxygenase n=1 Tax=Xanthomonas sp. SS TaxID=2724122 RepID=UPI00163B3CB7|nr:TauD/TfdA family dioxygenase [Xanthomonas sp. SS]QNH16243.1 Taurine catabolism dioxygenase TauD, TfdA family [Xanthomonas sp. SS]